MSYTTQRVALWLKVSLSQTALLSLSARLAIKLKQKTPELTDTIDSDEKTRTGF